MRHFRLSVLLLLLALGGCETGKIYVPVFGAGESETNRRTYIVRRGDTLYSIAFRYGLDYKDLAQANNISPPYTIYIDQRIRLTQKASDTSDGPPSSVARESSQPSSSSGSSKQEASAPIETSQVTDSTIRWQWPYDGEVVSGFSLAGSINKGIDIRGKSGDPVRSSADGIVVYAGGGLRGYGKLVIVKHNDRYLSAYGHNQSILVKEGQSVKSGQVVARIGGPTGEKNMLHFEIRRDGKPRDPLEYLPSRS